MNPELVLSASIPPDRRPRELSGRFAVVVHDLAPPHLSRIVSIVEAVAPRVGGKLIGAVVPCWHGLPLGSARLGSEARWIGLLGSAFGEVLQHGYTHRQDRPGLVSLVSGRSNELAGLPAAEALSRLAKGRDLIRRALGIEVDGFTPPSWVAGRLTMAEVSRLGFRYLAGFGAIRTADAPPIPLATWSWEWGVVASLGRLGESLGDARSRLRPEAMPCVVIHPIDLDRGYLPRVLRVIDRLRLGGREPVTFAELVATRAGGGGR